MKPEIPAAMTRRTSQSDYKDVLSAVFGLMSPDAGHIEWLLDRIEGNAGARRWA